MNYIDSGMSGDRPSANYLQRFVIEPSNVVVSFSLVRHVQYAPPPPPNYERTNPALNVKSQIFFPNGAVPTADPPALSNDTFSRASPADLAPALQICWSSFGSTPDRSSLCRPSAAPLFYSILGLGSLHRRSPLPFIATEIIQKR